MPFEFCFVLIRFTLHFFLIFNFFYVQIRRVDMLSVVWHEFKRTVKNLVDNPKKTSFIIFFVKLDLFQLN